MFDGMNWYNVGAVVLVVILLWCLPRDWRRFKRDMNTQLPSDWKHEFKDNAVYITQLTPEEYEIEHESVLSQREESGMETR